MLMSSKVALSSETFFFAKPDEGYTPLSYHQCLNVLKNGIKVENNNAHFYILEKAYWQITGLNLGIKCNYLGQLGDIENPRKLTYFDKFNKINGACGNFEKECKRRGYKINELGIEKCLQNTLQPTRDNIKICLKKFFPN